MLLTIILIAWLAITLLCVAVCRMAAQADFARARLRTDMDEQAKRGPVPAAEPPTRREQRDVLEPVA